MLRFMPVLILFGAITGCGPNKGSQKGTDESLKSISTVVSPDTSNRPTKTAESTKTGMPPGKEPAKTPGKGGALPPR